MPIGLLIGAMALAAATPCASVRPALPTGRVCLDVEHGVIVTDGRERAERLAAIASAGAQRFRRAFGRPVPTYAVVETVEGKVDATLDARLQAAGLAWRLPWLSEHDMAEGYRTSITRAVTAKAQAMGLGAAQTAALVASALAQQADKTSPATLRAREAGALPHELGHGWFIHAFWPDATVRVSDHYGGPAPDWMDETAAVMMEDDAMADSRRARFAAIYGGDDAVAKTRLLDLATFLSGGHPALPKLDIARDAGRVQVLTGEEGARIAAAASGFYLQARLFADYVLARSGDPAAFRSAAQAFAAGRNTAAWLAADGARLHLPGTIDALAADWHDWLMQRPPGTAA